MTDKGYATDKLEMCVLGWEQDDLFVLQERNSNLEKME